MSHSACNLLVATHILLADSTWLATIFCNLPLKIQI